MAVVYNRTFQHQPWIDNVSRVQADGPDGLNVRFSALEGELDEISDVFTEVDTAIKGIQKLEFLMAQAPLNLPASGATAEFPVEVYDNATMPPNIHRAYFAVVFPTGASPSTRIAHTFLYRNAPGNKTAVFVQFFNDNTTAAAQFSFRIMALKTQP